jgi:RadC-like JAB domain
VIVDACRAFHSFGYASCPFKLFGTGSESLTFFTVSLLLIVFGKIVPEKIGGIVDCLHTHHRLIAAENLFRGTMDSSVVYPREVAQAVLTHRARAVVSITIILPAHPAQSGRYRYDPAYKRGAPTRPRC